jgi:hypothetical protein
LATQAGIKVFSKVLDPFTRFSVRPLEDFALSFVGQVGVTKIVPALSGKARHEISPQWKTAIKGYTRAQEKGDFPPSN